jgi:hypothetical protein
MMTAASAVPTLAVGDPSRRRIGAAAVTALLTAVAFVAYLWLAKEIRVYYAHEPWQNDPYDAVVSFAFFFVPILAVLSFMRAALCKRARPLPVRRVRELLITSRLMLAVAGVTLGAEWLSVAAGAERELWDSATVVAVLALAVMTAVVAAAGVLVVRALRATPPAKLGPDWWSDAATFIDEYWRAGLPLGAVVPRFAKWTIDRAARAVRGRPLATAALLAITFGGLLATFQGFAEEGFAPAVFVLYMSVAAASMFAFLVIAGAHLQLAGEREPMAGRSRRLADSVASAAAAFVAALAFRDLLQPIFRFVPGRGVGHLLGGCVVVAVAVAIGVFAVESGLRLHQPSEIRRT